MARLPSYSSKPRLVPARVDAAPRAFAGSNMRRHILRNPGSPTWVVFGVQLLQALAGNMGVDLSRCDVAMSEQ
jgi:hypothetical protein